MLWLRNILIESREVGRSSVAFRPIKDSFWFYFSKLACYVFLYHLCCILSCMVYYTVHAAFVRIKLMMINFKTVSQNWGSRILIRGHPRLERPKWYH